MADVLLTATNPADSSVVPVACNEKGELKLEEPLVFDGTLGGDLSVSGSGTFGGALSVSENIHGSKSVFGSGTDNQPVFRAYSYTLSDFTASINADGSAVFEGPVRSNAGYVVYPPSASTYAFATRDAADSTWSAFITAVGSASFASDVVVGSRSQRWTLVEQGGLCHMVPAAALGADINSADVPADAPPPVPDGEKEYPVLRDVFQELNMIESVLEEVMEKLRLTPPAGWEVWDGSDN